MESIYGFTKRIKSSSLNDIFIILTLVLSGYFYYYERRAFTYLDDNFDLIIFLRILITILTIVMLVGICFKNGLYKRYSVITFTCLFFVIPQILNYVLTIYDNDVYESDLTMYLSIIADYIVKIPLFAFDLYINFMNKYMGFSKEVSINLIFILCILGFITGIIFKQYIFKQIEIKNKNKIASI